MDPNKNPDPANAVTGLPAMPKPQKIAVSVLGVFAISIISFWVWQMRAQIRQPFNPSQDTDAAVSSTSSVNALLQGQDTDKDGLADYDEIYSYKTSPYLEDSDSDGLSDKAEVAAGTDPNCPQGKSCNQEIAIPDSIAATSTVISTTTPASVPDSGSQTINESDLQQILSGNIDGATLRQLLISTGAATAEELAPLSDENLLQSYQEALKNQSQ